MSYITITIEGETTDTVTVVVQDAVYVGNGGGGAVDSVNGQAGTVTLDTDNIGEGVINLYHTDARVAANANVAANTTHRTAADNPHGVTKAQVGLANVDNTSDANKPVSTATQAALDGKVDDAQVLTNVPAGAVFTDTVYDDTSIQAEVTANTSKVSADGSVTTHSDVTNAGSGAIITNIERTKLTGIEPGATADQTGAEIVTVIDTELGNTDWQSGGGGGGGWETIVLTSDIVIENNNTIFVPIFSLEVPVGQVLSFSGCYFHQSGVSQDFTALWQTSPDLAVEKGIAFDLDNPSGSTSEFSQAFLPGTDINRAMNFKGFAQGHSTTPYFVEFKIRQQTAGPASYVRAGSFIRYKLTPMT